MVLMLALMFHAHNVMFSFNGFSTGLRNGRRKLKMSIPPPFLLYDVTQHHLGPGREREREMVKIMHIDLINSRSKPINSSAVCTARTPITNPFNIKKITLTLHSQFSKLPVFT